MSTASLASEGRAPGPRGHLLVGVLPEMRSDPLGLLLRSAAEHGDLVRLPMGPFRIFLARHPDDVQRVLLDNQQNYGRQTRGYEALRRTLGNGLVTSEGDFWLRQRRIAQPAFHK